MTIKKINVFKYDDALRVLKAFMRKNRLPARRFLKYCGIKSTNFICEVMHSRQMLRGTKMCRIMDAMGLEGFEGIYFGALLDLQNARGGELKKHCRDNVRLLKKIIYKLK